MNQFLFACVLSLFLGHTAYADSAVPWQLGFQDPATPVMESIINLHHQIMFYLILIAVFVCWMMVRTIMLFHETKNTVPSKVVHGTLLEIVWTITPSFVLLMIFIPSFNLLYAMDKVIEPSVTVKAIGHQWYWTYEYSDVITKDDEPIEFESYMVPEEDLEDGQLRLLEVDNRVVVPVNTHVRVIVTSADVLHSWAVPSMGIKMDAVPGRLNQTSMYVKREGVYYGQCSEICGVNHGYMPIVVEAVSMDDYISWLSNKAELAEEVIEAI